MGIRYWHYVSAVIIATLLSFSANAATRKYVGMPSAQSAATSGVPAKVGGNLQFTGQPMTGEYIPATGTGTKGVPMKIIPRTDFSIGRMLNHAKGGMRGGAIGMAASVAVGMMLDEIDAFIDENTKQPMKMGKQLTPAGSLYWCFQDSSTYCNNAEPSRTRLANPTEFPIVYKKWFPGSELCSATYAIQANGSQVLIKYSFNNPGQCGIGSGGTSEIRYYRQGTCPAPTRYDSEFMQCVQDGPVTLADADYDRMMNFASGQNAAWLQGLLKDACAGSPSPGACFNELKEGSALTGPATVSGPSTTKTTTTTSSTGVLSQTSTTTNTTYNIKYGPNYYDYSKTTQITTTTDGQPVSDSTETEPEEVAEEEPLPEDEEEEEQYSFSDTDFPEVKPFYEQQYPDGIQGVWDSSRADLEGSEFIGFLNSFIPSFSGTCPSWSLGFNIMASANFGTHSFQALCYVFDFIKVIILVTAVFTCRAIIFGG